MCIFPLFVCSCMYSICMCALIHSCTYMCVCVHVCAHIPPTHLHGLFQVLGGYTEAIYKQPEVWTMEVVDMARTTHLPLWGGCVMSTHTLNTSLNLVEQAVYALLPTHLTPSNFIHTTNTIPTSHTTLCTTPPDSNTFPHGENYMPCLQAWDGCTVYPEHLTTFGYINIILCTSHIYSTSLHPHPYNTSSTPHTTHPTLLHYIHHPHLTQHTPHSCTIYTIHTSHNTPHTPALYTSSTPHTTHPTLLHCIHHPHLTQHTPHSCTIYIIHTSHNTPHTLALYTPSTFHTAPPDPSL